MAITRIGMESRRMVTQLSSTGKNQPTDHELTSPQDQILKGWDYSILNYKNEMIYDYF